MSIYFQLLKESFNFAAKSLIDNKLRTFLSLLGVTVGIFSIIGVLSAVDSLNAKVQEGLSGLDKNTIYLSKFSFAPTNIPRWQRLRFPQVSYQEYEFLQKEISQAEAIAYTIFGMSSSVKYEGKTIKSVEMNASTAEIQQIESIKIDKGRFFSEAESNSGSAVVVLGYEIAKQLFDTENPIGKEIRAYGRNFLVIGTTIKYGEIQMSADNKAFIPASFIRTFMNTGKDGVPSAVVFKPKKNLKSVDFEQVLIQKMRLYRGLKPDEIDNFFINKISSFTDMIDQTFSMLNLIGWIIGGFSILVGGFGIANIMFVSVKERTNLIGIQKSLGAKNQFILFQFLFEAVLLALIGGFLGLFFVWIATTIATNVVDDFKFILSFSNIFIGLSVSVAVGIISGIIPAIGASKLNPVEAIRTGQ